MANDYDQENRARDKFLKKFNWYDTEIEVDKNSWKADIPQALKIGQKRAKSKLLDHQQYFSSQIQIRAFF